MDINELKEDVIWSFNEWLEAGFPIKDTLGLKEEVLNSFKLKLDKLIQYVQEEKKEKIREDNL